eukprot:g10914.t1
MHPVAKELIDRPTHIKNPEDGHLQPLASEKGLVSAVNKMIPASFGKYVDIASFGLELGGVIREYVDPAKKKTARCPKMLLYVDGGKSGKNKNCWKAACPRLWPISEESWLLNVCPTKRAVMKKHECWVLEYSVTSPLSNVIERIAERQLTGTNPPKEIACEIANDLHLVAWNVDTDEEKPEEQCIINIPQSSWFVRHFDPSTAVRDRKRKQHAPGDDTVREREAGKNGAERDAYNVQWKDFALDALVPERVVMPSIQDVNTYYVPTTRSWLAAVPLSWRPARRGTGEVVDRLKTFGRTAKCTADEMKKKHPKPTAKEIGIARRLIVQDVCDLLEIEYGQVSKEENAAADAEIEAFLFARYTNLTKEQMQELHEEQLDLGDDTDELGDPSEWSDGDWVGADA